MLKRLFTYSCAAVSIAGILGTATVPAALAHTTSQTSTPIKHVVVLFQENVSFDHYFGTYPNAQNPAGEPLFTARAKTPRINGLTASLLTSNPNGVNPVRLDPSEAVTCDQNHHYGDEQDMYHGGLVDNFVAYSRNTCSSPAFSKPNLTMGYYDGNTVTALWNYAQHFAMSDNSYSTTFGPSTPGAINLVAGQTWGAISTDPEHDTYGVVSPDIDGIGTIINDPDPTFDDCSNISGTTYPTVSMIDTNKNIGDLLNAKGVTWGWFEGGFRPTSWDSNGKATCGSLSANVGGVISHDYIPHHQPFQYYASTSNPHHLPPSSVAMIGRDDQANHQYDLQDFWSAVDAGNMPAVSFLKAPGYQDGHAAYSDPIDEQVFIVNTINRLQKTKEWKNTAVIIAYDDSDGWYDHVMPPIVKQSSDTAHDGLFDNSCGTAGAGEHQDRCGYGPRQPLLIVSPWAKQDYVDHSVTDQASVLRFIEDNWDLGRIGDDSYDEIAGTLNGMFDFGHADRDRNHRLFLDPDTGMVAHNHDHNH